MRLKFTLFAFAFLIFSFLGGAAFAQEDPKEVAEKYGITFPIPELGNCSDYYTCRQYCEDPVNYDDCKAFAKKKGFHEKEGVKLDIRNSDFWKKTQSELGCNSVDACRALCERNENFDKCDAFAKKYDLSGGHVDDPYEQEFLKKAKEILGCDSPSSCMSFCDKEENWDKCSEFAKQMGFRGGEQFGGPGGCNTRESCETYCRAHPQECGYEGSSNYDPAEWCNKTPDCTWTGDTCQCAKIEGLTPDEYCKKYPDRCSGYTDPSVECTKYPGCSWNGSTCQCEGYSGSYGSYDPATECAKYTGCSWKNNNCECSGSGYQQTTCPSGSYWDGSNCVQISYDPASECARQSGCSWTGSSCQCSGGGESQTYSEPLTSPTPSPAVYGAAVVRSLYETLLQYLLGN